MNRRNGINSCTSRLMDPRVEKSPRLMVQQNTILELRRPARLSFRRFPGIRGSWNRIYWATNLTGTIDLGFKAFGGKTH
jgi:hypothetical protein